MNREQNSELSAEVEAGRKRLSEASAEAARAHARTARLQADLTRLSQQLEAERSQHKLQVNHHYSFILLLALATLIARITLLKSCRNPKISGPPLGIVYLLLVQALHLFGK